MADEVQPTRDERATALAGMGHTHAGGFAQWYDVVRRYTKTPRGFVSPKDAANAHPCLYALDRAATSFHVARLRRRSDGSERLAYVYSAPDETEEALIIEEPEKFAAFAIAVTAPVARARKDWMTVHHDEEDAALTVCRIYPYPVTVGNGAAGPLAFDWDSGKWCLKGNGE